MMNLLVVKPLTYISPSTFITWKKCQNRVYQAKLAGHPFIHRKSSKAAAMGTAFDAFIKHAILTRRKESSVKSLQYMLSKLDLEDGLDKEAIVREARALATAFIKRKHIDEFVNLNNRVQLDVEGYRICDGVPLLGIMDIICNDIPVDLKTRGFGKNAKTYSHGGYVKKSTRDGTIKLGVQEPLESKSKDWATQLLFYSKIRNLPEHQGRIIEVCNQGDGQFETAFHDSKFSSDFVEIINTDIQIMWTCVSGMYAQIKEPEPGWHCREYGTICEVASRCPKFMAGLSSDVESNK